MKALIFDTETTDLIKNTLIPVAKQPRIIEFFGHIVEDDGTVIDELEFLCHPGIPIPPVITEITGWKDEDVKGKPPFASYAQQVINLFAKADAAVAHNLSYDYQIVEFEFARLLTNQKVVWPKIKVCTVQETEFLKGHRLNLTDLHKYLFGEGFENAHRARNDVNALTRCWVEMRKRGMV